MSVRFQSFAIIIEMGDNFDWNNIQKHGEQAVIQNYLHGEDKGVRENIVLHDSYQADETVTEIEEWKQKVIKCVGDISCIFKNCIK